MVTFLVPRTTFVTNNACAETIVTFFGGRVMGPAPPAGFSRAGIYGAPGRVRARAPHCAPSAAASATESPRASPAVNAAANESPQP